MKMNISRKLVWRAAGIFLVVTLMLIFGLTLWSKYNPGVGLGNGYRLIYERSDDVHIIKNKKVIVRSTIVDFYGSTDFIFGLRLPVKFLACDNFSYTRIKVLNEKHFFILRKSDGQVFTFKDRLSFEGKASQLTGFNVDNINYSKLDSVWEKYERLYKGQSQNFNCEYYPIKTFEYEKSSYEVNG